MQMQTIIQAMCNTLLLFTLQCNKLTLLNIVANYLKNAHKNNVLDKSGGVKYVLCFENLVCNF